MDTEIYEIDYRGPETHSFVPPPDHSHGKPHSAHDKSSAAATKATGFTGIDHATMKQKVRFELNELLISSLSSQDLGDFISYKISRDQL